MGLFELFLLAVGLSMDAFAVSVCKGLAIRKATLENSVIVGLWFGGFQALMPVIGFLLGSRFYNYISSVDHWIAFFLLSFIGISMIVEARNEESGASSSSSVDVKTMFILAVATSIDALAVGITFAFLSVKIIPAVSLIGLTTFVLSFLGVKFGSFFGEKYRSGAETAGGIILILLGLKILLEHLGII